ncbi:helix-turn-helix domain protein [Ktedonobacter racemifer DSM 44963]|uniref:Helix-turn-helix domain protein n=2 Tax=Ktedonobacter racemifer TaxID=363277 RepID=D6TPB1_KTERA|nr:helix-turn-helix domain protein [Ktedonobacter racemifer DSM 44963]
MSMSIQELKMAWLAAREAGDAQTQLQILREHPTAQAELTDFIAGYYATTAQELEENATLLPLTQRALQSALQRVLAPQARTATLVELRKSRNLKKVDVARALRLSVDVWNKFEAGAIEAASLSQRQLERLAGYFQLSLDQFATLLDNSQPALTYNRRQTSQAARKQEQGPQKQSFAEAIARSNMSSEDQAFWLEQ